MRVTTYMRAAHELRHHSFWTETHDMAVYLERRAARLLRHYEPKLNSLTRAQLRAVLTIGA